MNLVSLTSNRVSYCTRDVMGVIRSFPWRIKKKHLDYILHRCNDYFDYLVFDCERSSPYHPDLKAISRNSKSFYVSEIYHICSLVCRTSKQCDFLIEWSFDNSLNCSLISNIKEL